ncbi:MAG: RsmB/NOP family class I SAM-dependent RNA methyltransferase [Betaproteobacteria bacterium]|jgi:16S rRNA (cytosine967-C5)-methyltransferase
MHPGALLQLTSSLLQAVLRLDQPADKVVSAFFKSHRALGPRERHTLAETAYAVLRRRLLLQHLAQSGTGPLERRLAQLAWQGDRDFLRRGATPEENTWLEQVQNIDRATLADKLRHNLPDWVSTPLRQALGDQGFWALVGALDGVAPLDLRVNTLKAKREDALAGLARDGIVAEPTPYSSWGLRVQGKPALNRAPAFLQGEVEVQDEGSQLLALLTGAGRGEMVVDFCAGAGGKTLALGAMMRNTGRLYAFDTSDHRLAALKPRLARSGLSNVHPVRIAHERDDRIRRLEGKIDRVLVDAPCSGLGTLRRNPDLKWRQSPASVQELCALQARILASAARLLRPGGQLVYGTCSLLRSENEDIAQDFSAAHAGSFEAVPAGDVLAEARVQGGEGLVSEGFFRTWPHLHQTDGFFAAVWRKR